MKIKWLVAVLVLTLFISGCIEWGGDQIEPEFNDNALKMEVKIREKEENRRILPGQTIRMVVYLTNQVENATEHVYLKIINPYGIRISKVDCGYDCICEWDGTPSDGCDDQVNCTFNGCYYQSIQSLDEEEITFGLKIPSEEEITTRRDLRPEIMLEYNYSGSSSLYVPIYKQGEQPAEPKKEFTQTTGPIHVDIDSDNWVREGDLFPLYVNVKDVVHTSEKITIDSDKFRMEKDHAFIEEDPEVAGEKIGLCDFTRTNDHYIPIEEINLPLRNPLVCTLKAAEPTAPMVKAPIIIDYRYKYRVERTETIRVEKALFGIF